MHQPKLFQSPATTRSYEPGPALPCLDRLSGLQAVTFDGPKSDAIYMDRVNDVTSPAVTAIGAIEASDSFGGCTIAAHRRTTGEPTIAEAPRI